MMYVKEFGSSGLTSMNQIVATTDNRMFSIGGESTSGMGSIQRIIFPENMIQFSKEMSGLMLSKILPPRKDERGRPSGIMPLALVIGTCKSIPKEIQP